MLAHSLSARSQQEGVAALWTGLGPNIARNAIINAAELASYDQVKEVTIPPFSFPWNSLRRFLISYANYVMLRAFLIVLSYMQTILKIPGFTDNVLTHILAGLGAGFFAVSIGSPIDVVTFSL